MAITAIVAIVDRGNHGNCGNCSIVALTAIVAIVAMHVAHPLQRLAREECAMFGLLGWILFGLVAGVIAKLVMPGRDPGGIIVTMLLGVAGAILGGFLGRALGFYGEGESAGWIMSILGAIAILAIYRAMAGRRVRHV